MEISIQVILQGSMLAVMIWVGTSLQGLIKSVAVHDHVIFKDHGPRLEKVEDKMC